MRLRETAQGVGRETLAGLAWLPVLVGTVASLVLLPAYAAVIADTSRRATGRQTRRPGEDLTTWLGRRRATGMLWRQDVPLFGLVLVLGIPSFLCAVTGLSMIVVLASAALNPSGLRMHVGSTTVPAGPDAAIAVVFLALCAAALHGLGRIRATAVGALSDAREAELATEVGTLRRGRATLVDAFEAERRRIERDLHDGAQQQLVAVALELGQAQLAALALPAGPGRDEVAAALTRAQDRADAALSQLRESVRRIHPAVLSDRGLFAGLDDLVAHAGRPVTLAASGDDARVAGPCATAAYFVVAEALTNVAKHAGEASASVVATATDELTVSVTDDGPGGADATRGTGLAGLAERVETLGGWLSVQSASGHGTTVRATLPLVPVWEKETT